MSILRKSDATLLPVDSEHNALLKLYYLLVFNIRSTTKNTTNQILITLRLLHLVVHLSILTFLNLKHKIKHAIKHPTWDMGEKISVDSSTMMNKGLEIIEAKLLFNLNLEKINAIIHRQSKVHALVEFYDGTIIAHMSDPDMKIPISYALTFPNRVYKSASTKFVYSNLTFEDIPISKFPCYKLARSVEKLAKILD